MTLPVTTPQTVKSRSLPISTRGKVTVGRVQEDAPSLDPQPLDVELAVQPGDHDIAVAGGFRAVHDQDVAVADVRLAHALARHAHHEGGGRIMNEQFVEIEDAFEMIVGGRREARAHLRADHRQRHTQARKGSSREDLEEHRIKSALHECEELSHSYRACQAFHGKAGEWRTGKLLARSPWSEHEIVVARR